VHLQRASDAHWTAPTPRHPEEQEQSQRACSCGPFEELNRSTETRMTNSRCACCGEARERIKRGRTGNIGGSTLNSIGVE
jgi:hypothetical protein